MADDQSLTFHWADYFVFGVFLVFSTLLGIFFGWRDRKKANSEDFLMGGGDMHWIPTALSMQASFLSAIYILTTPVEIYNFGTTYFYMSISYITTNLISANIYLPIFYRLKLISAYAYLEMRFNRIVRLCGSATFCVMVLLYMSVVLYTPAIALAQVTGLSIYIMIPLTGVVCVAYTFLGGMKATIWNDFFQMCIISVGLIIIISIGMTDFAGITNVWEINEAGGRIRFDVFNVDPTIRTTFWTQVVGGTFVNTTLSASSQTIIQKFLSVKTLRKAKWSLYLNMVTSILFLVLVTLIGLVMYAYYAHCDPVINGDVEKADQMLPLYVMEIMGHLHGLPGLFIATTFSAALSSVSGSLNALSAVTLYDFIRPVYFNTKGKELDDRTSAMLSRFLTLGFGLFVIAMGFIAQFLGDLVLTVALSIFGFVGGPVLGLLTVGIFFPFVNWKGALAGLLTSLGICSWIAIGAIVSRIPPAYLERRVDGCPNNAVTDAFNATTVWATAAYDETSMYTSAPLPPPTDYLWVYKISHMYYGLIAVAISIIVAIPVSLITGRAKGVDPKLTYDWGGKMCCYCPQPCRACLRCGGAISSDVHPNGHDDDDDDCSHNDYDGVVPMKVPPSNSTLDEKEGVDNPGLEVDFEGNREIKSPPPIDTTPPDPPIDYSAAPM